MNQTEPKGGHEKRTSGKKQIALLELHIAEKEQQLTEIKDKYLRLAADFDNFRKRAEKETQTVLNYAGEGVLKKIIPVIDDLERALQNQNESSEQSLREGLALIHKKFLAILKELQVEPIESLLKPFNPEEHHALLTREREGVEPDIVIEEFEKGYRYKEHILRYAKVVVSK